LILSVDSRGKPVKIISLLGPTVVKKFWRTLIRVRKTKKGTLILRLLW